MDNKSNLSLILTSILSFVLGIVLLVATEEILVTVNYILVCIFAIIGVVQVVSFFVSGDYKNNIYNSLILGIVFIWLSLFIYVYYTMIIIILPVIFSLYSFIMGVILLIRYFSLRNVVKIKCRRYLFLSILSFIIGLILIFRPALSVYTYFKITGIYVIFVAILFFFEFIKNVGKK